MIKRLLPALIVTLSMIAVPLVARAVVAPSVEVGEMRIVRSVADDEDLLVFFDLNLPSGWDDSGEGDPYPLGSAQVRLLDTSTTPATVLQERDAPVTDGAALGAFYLEAGHGGPAWGSTDLRVQVIANPLSFDTPLSSAVVDAVSAFYLTTSWATTGDDWLSANTDDQDLLCDGLKELLVLVEDYPADTSAWESGDLVLHDGLTDDGSTMVVDAFASAGSILSTCFTVGVTRTGGTFAPGDGVLDENLSTSITSSDFWANRFSTLASDWSFSSAELFAVVLVFLVSIVAFIVAFVVSGSGLYATVIGGLFMYGGSHLAPWILQLVLIIIALLWVVIGTRIFGRIPR
jgi:hypothetical protein